ncbi:protein of unknown function [Hyphomicrobium sp. 1Nfss2.1]
MLFLRAMFAPAGRGTRLPRPFFWRDTIGPSAEATDLHMRMPRRLSRDRSRAYVSRTDRKLAFRLAPALAA